MSPSNNDNVSFNRNYNVNDNVRRSSQQVDRIADRLMQKLSADNSSREWYCKVAWKLSESVIENNLEIALKGKSPTKYFTWLCKRYM